MEIPPEQLLRTLMAGGRPGPRQARKLKCPICNEENEYSPGDERSAVENRVSHGGRFVFTNNGSCPICMEDNLDKMVSLLCGHCVCRSDFERLGGKTGEEATMSPQEAADADHDPNAEEDIPEFLRMMQNLPIPPSRLGNWIQNMEEIAAMDEESDSEDEDAYYSASNNSTDSEMPPLLQQPARLRGGNRQAATDEQEEGDNSEDLPDLVGRGQQDSSEDEESSDDDMPGLIARSNNNNNESSDEDGSSLDGLPELLDRNMNSSSEESSDDSSAPDLMPRDAADESSSSSDIPALVARGGDDNSSDEESLPALIQRSNRNSESSAEDDDDDDDVPALAARRDDDSSSDEDDLPGLGARGEDSEDSMPEGLTRNQRRRRRNRRNRRNRRRNANADRNNQENPSTEENNQGSSQQANTQDANTGEVPSTEELRASCAEMRPSQLKSLLRGMGISTDGYIDKSELIEAYVEAKVSRGEAELYPLPPLESASCPTRKGCWFLSPKEDNTNLMELHYAWVTEGQTEVTLLGEFAAGSMLSVEANGVAWIYGPPRPESNSPVSTEDSWEVYQAEYVGTVRKRFECRANAQIVPDCSNGIWCISPSDGQTEFQLTHMTENVEKGHVVHAQMPRNARLVMDGVGGGVWVYVPESAGSSNTLTDGIWHIGRDGEAELAMSDTHEQASLTTDGGGTGLWVLSPNSDGSLLSRLLVESGIVERFEQNLDVDFDLVQNIVDYGSDGAYIHCRRGDRWKLLKATLRNSNMTEFCDCSKPTLLASDGIGGVWMWKKVGRAARTVLRARADQTLSNQPTSRYSPLCTFGTL